ncbi:succinylglutamate desuccinylase/aspartoacylase family protein [Desulfopila sp. IMCC35008]|uniref:succinylglutamate desuccinylase/aspartoacylase family protein n=1 Tax=Desulfopila sp. IMCC35008 TaxID=2653858 RepID=UPI0013D71D5A|nr:succinylglutamate desuccinylase/aspartoacylase family protein [Desulfopila sp. IMCC35008]
MTINVGSFELLNTHIRPATRCTIQLDLGKIGGHSTSVEIINGRNPGPVLCLTAALHGDELNGIEIIRQLMQGIDPEIFCGVIVAVPVVNQDGYHHKTRYVDGVGDLNRSFPGDQNGTCCQQMAYTLFTEVISHCDAVIDVHTGSSGRENLPQLRVDLSIKQNEVLSSGFSRLSIIQSNPPRGSLREASSLSGIPALVMEIGGSQGVEPEKVLLGVEALQALLGSIEMTAVPPFDPEFQRVYYGGGWIRSEREGIFIAKACLGDVVQAGDILAEIIDPLLSTTYRVEAPLHCTILGRSHNQYVGQGTGLFRVGIERVPI